MANIFPIKLAIDHDKKVLRMRVTAEDGHEIRASVDMKGLTEFMAMLSHCEYVLAQSMAGTQIPLPLDPAKAFEPVAGNIRLDVYDGAARAQVGVDDSLGHVAMTILGTSGRISSYRIEPHGARILGAGLVDAADKIAPQPTRPN